MRVDVFFFWSNKTIWQPNKTVDDFFFTEKVHRYLGYWGHQLIFYFNFSWLFGNVLFWQKLTWRDCQKFVSTKIICDCWCWRRIRKSNVGDDDLYDASFMKYKYIYNIYIPIYTSCMLYKDIYWSLCYAAYCACTWGNRLRCITSQAMSQFNI